MQLYKLPSTFFAQADYGECAYGSGGYNDNCGTSTTTQGNGTLSNTGTPVILGGTIGVALLICAVVLFTQSRKNKRK